MNSNASFKVYNASAGSGKTFTLVKEYLKILFKSESNYHFKKILAITFTNKAAAEMKERILENLKEFSEGKENDLFFEIHNKGEISKEKIHQRAKIILEKILQNYTAFSITTIDSFTHKLIRSFAYDLGLPLNFEVEMDGPKLISEAVDVLISKIGTDKKLTELLIDFAINKSNADKSWDVSTDINKTAKIILNETDVLQLKKLSNTSIDDFLEFRTYLLKEIRLIEEAAKKIGSEALHLIDVNLIKHTSFFYSDLPKHFKKLLKLTIDPTKKINFTGRLAKNIQKGVFYSDKKPDEEKQAIDRIAEQLLSMYKSSEIFLDDNFNRYVLMNLILKNLIPLAVLKNVQQELEQIKDQNQIRMVSEFNHIISDKIRNEPSLFIYERVGEKYQHYFIDEMQDTSELQWQNLIPLIDDALSQESGSLMLVGDAKQAIYRWRGGKAEQFMSLSSEEDTPNTNPFFREKSIQNLGYNYRSYSELIHFNNSFFTHASQFLENQLYSKLYEVGNSQKENSKKGGFVQINFLDTKDLEKEEKLEIYPQKVLELVNEIKTEFKNNEICILVRKKKEGVAIAEYLSAHGLPILSSETLLLKTSQEVLFVINMLEYIHNPENKEAKFSILNYLFENQLQLKDQNEFYLSFIDLTFASFFEEIKKIGFDFQIESFTKYPLYEAVEYILRAFVSFDRIDSYVQFFLDFVLDFQKKKYIDLQLFLEFWNQKKDSLSVSVDEQSDAVRIMTIHKSKGLEFPVVVFPYDLDMKKDVSPQTWVDLSDSKFEKTIPQTLIPATASVKNIGNLGEEIFTDKEEKNYLDNYNLLYVALTRAVEQLFVVSELDFDKDGEEKTNKFSGLFINYLKSIEKWNTNISEYSFGQKKRSSKKKNEEEVRSLQNFEFLSSNWVTKEIVLATKSSQMWGEEKETSKQYGILIHEILAQIFTVNQVDSIINKYWERGITDKNEALSIKSKINELVNHPEISICFDKQAKTITEREIITSEGKMYVPDRVSLLPTNEVTLLDYKTGTHLEEHFDQLINYKHLLEAMGYKVSKALLVYLDGEITVKYANKY